jgi:hypothetical protein
MWNAAAPRRDTGRLLRRGLRSCSAARTIVGMSEGIVPRDELQAAIEARRELGADMEPAVIDAFVERIERRLSERAVESELSLKKKRDHQKEMVLGAMGISVPLFALAGIFTGLPGVLAVCAVLAVIALMSSR